jgi:hypothetical protein
MQGVPVDSTHPYTALALLPPHPASLLTLYCCCLRLFILLLLLLWPHSQYENSYGHEGGEGQFDEAYRAALEPFWRAQKQEISQASTDISEYKSQQLPLARIKKVCVCALMCTHPEPCMQLQTTHHTTHSAVPPLAFTLCVITKQTGAPLLTTQTSACCPPCCFPAN